MKLTRKQIDMIIEHTKPELKGKCASLMQELGYFQKENANWAYHAGWTYEGDLVVTQYGRIM